MPEVLMCEDMASCSPSYHTVNLISLHSITVLHSNNYSCNTASYKIVCGMHDQSEIGTYLV